MAPAAFLLLLPLSLLLLLTFAPTPSRALDDQHDSLFRFGRRLLPRLSRRAGNNVPPEGYVNPITSGGSMLTQVVGVSPPDLGEPVNVILSANSDPLVLKNQENDGGFLNYAVSLGFSGECLGQHLGNSQKVNLGDGNGYLNETAVMRYNYGDPSLGTCTETVQGGNHFRYWIQDGPNVNTGAYFMAFSYEKPASAFHDIIFNGYNHGRDWMIGNITQSTIPTADLFNGSTYSGSTSSGGYTYATSVQYVSGMLQNSSVQINHNDTVGNANMSAIDGLVAVLTVSIPQKPQGAPNNAFRTSPWIVSPLLALSLLLTL